MGHDRQERVALRAAFSLLELLLVITLIGIIATLVVPRVTSSSDAARDKLRESHITQMNALIEQYTLDNDGPPTDLTDLAPTYLPEGLPTDPDGGSYALNSTTHRVDYTP